MKTAIIDTGGGMRSIYGAGALDWFLEHGIGFDSCIGVSGGSANIASFLAGQQGRNYHFYTEYSHHPQYMGVGEWVHNGSFLNLDYIYSTLSNTGGINPLNYEKMMQNRTAFTIVATDACSGKPHYFGRADVCRDDYSILKASCCVPMLCRAQAIGEHAYFDGGVSDPIPLQRALREGCERVVVILPKFTGHVRREHFAVAGLLLREYPAVAAALQRRRALYIRQLAHLRALAQMGRAFLLTPDSPAGIPGMLERNPAQLDAFYRRGYADAERLSRILY